MKLPDGDRLQDAIDMWHDDSWSGCPGGKPVVADVQMPFLLQVLEPWFREEFAPKRKPAKAKPSGVSAAKPLGVTSQARARRLVRERSGGMCEVCGTARATNYQHRKGKAHCSPVEMWAPSNGLDVCGQGNATGCHGLIHQNPKAAIANGWTVPSWSDPKSTAAYRLSQLVLLDDEGGFEPVESEVA